MIEQLIKDYLAETLAIPSAMELPPNPPDRFVVVEKTGSSVENGVFAAMIAVQSYGGSLLAAAELNEQVKAAMDDLPQLDQVCRCELNSDYNYTDPSQKRYRYQAVFNVTHY